MLVSGITLTCALAAGVVCAIGGILMGTDIKSSEPDLHSPISDDASRRKKLLNMYADFI